MFPDPEASEAQTWVQTRLPIRDQLRNGWILQKIAATTVEAR